MTKTSKIIIGIIVAIIVIGGTWYGLSRQPAEEEVIKIGFIGPLTGDVAMWGQNQRKGIEVALEEINKEGIKGKLLEVIFEDSQCNPVDASKAVTKLINIDKVIAIIGDTCSSATLAGAPIAEQNKIVLISAVSGADSISEAGDYIFRNFLPNRYYSKEGAKYIEEKGIKRVAILYINNDYGVNIWEVFKENFEGDIVFEEGYNVDTQDFRTILAKIKDSNAEVVFIAGYYPDGVLLLKQRAELGIEISFFGASDAYDDPELVNLAGDAAEGFIYQTVPMGAGPRFSEFKKLYEEKYREEPGVFSDFAYDTLWIIVEAMKKCEIITSECVKNNLYETKFNGASNYIEFDDKGDLITSKTIIKEVKDGKMIIKEE